MSDENLPFELPFLEDSPEDIDYYKLKPTRSEEKTSLEERMKEKEEDEMLNSESGDEAEQ